jgi:hypothetical protein
VAIKTEQTFTLSANTALDWLAKLRKSGDLPLPIVAALTFVEGLRGKQIEVSIRVVDTKTPKGIRS